MTRLVILGGGESGVGTAILGKKKGYDVFVSDKGKIKEKYKDQINFIALTENTSKEVISFLKKRNFSYYVLVNTFKYQELVLKINSLPTNIILDKNGIIKDISGSIPLDPMSLKYNSTNIEKTLNSLIK